VTIHGKVKGDALAIGGSVVLGSNAVVEGNCISIGGVIVKDGGRRSGAISLKSIPPDSQQPFPSPDRGLGRLVVGFAIISVLIFLMILAIAMILVALIPKPLKSSPSDPNPHLPCLSLGLLATILIARWRFSWQSPWWVSSSFRWKLSLSFVRF